VVLVVPLYERQASGLYRNSAVIIDADGTLLGVYRKMHIPHDPLFEEKYYFAPGDADDSAPGRDGSWRGSHGFRVWRTRYADIGVLICWDQWYPEAARITSLLGAEILFYPTAIGWHPAERAESGQAQQEAWRTIQRSHAIANGVFVASPNRVGFEPEPNTDGLQFYGHSFISDPFGRIIAEAGDEPQVIVATCDPALVEETRRNWPFLRDRRVDAYGGILSRYLA
jgi:N-carbamoylputrescine amidase